MNGALIQLLVLAGVAIFLILRLRSVLGTREGFEKPPIQRDETESRRPNLEVIEGGPDHDIIDHVPENSPAAVAFADMKRVDQTFNVGEFLGGAKGAYEMILMAYETGNLSSVQPFISEDIYDAFAAGIEAREKNGITVEASFIGVSETAVQDAEFDTTSREAEITIRFMGEFNYTVRDKAGDIIEGGPTTVKRQRDVWTFARTMGTDDPNWTLVATGE
ncbi:preprotein translocase subunit Tim44 [Marivivens niveibacter]|uniref:Preprotein translocase subunit Tim44 n=1 Tax=Marivivens niveibacter TaxID=1930667 RepID=A0A251X070_9RHOB|nr:Tim44/TimA family putative adaptor protein [Marivivens niveibacter]OUD09704.1 preprotein translocase subunit Tim44 [Marivivens niveibacter]